MKFELTSNLIGSRICGGKVENQKRKKEYLIFKILENNIFVLKIVWKLSKSRFVLKLFMTIINSIIPTINIVITRNIIFLVESNSTKSIESFKKVLFMIFVLMGIQLIPNIFSVWNATLIEPILHQKLPIYDEYS